MARVGFIQSDLDLKMMILYLMDRVAARFTPEECGKLEEMLRIVDRELMPEVGPLPERGEEA